MRYLVALYFVFLSIASNAAIYYVSSSGNDSNPGTSENQPWKSLAKVNSFTPRPGDQILFKRGDSWTGTLTVTASGTSGSPIVYGDYGSGEKPKFHGSEPITGWTLHSGNIWKASVSKNITQLFINTERMKLARHPNMGYLNICSTNGPKTLSCTILDQNINYKGAKWAGRTNEWSLMTQTIIGSIGQQLELDAQPEGGLKVGNGFYLLNKLEFLDSPGEWYYNNSTRTVYLWTPNGNPPQLSNIRGSAYNDIVSIDRKNYVTIRNLDLRHAAQRGVIANNVSYLTLDNLNISSPEIDGILITNGDSHHNIITNNEIDGANDQGIKFWSSYSTFADNRITNTAMLENFGLSGMSWSGSGRAIDVNGRNNTIRYNSIENCGYLGIGLYKAPGTILEFNYIKNTCLVKDDGGAIYMWEENVNNEGCSGTIIRNNIVDGAVGTREGLDPIYKVQGFGIYLDDNSKNITVENNTVIDCGGANIFLHLNRNCTVRNNTTMGAIRNLLVNGDKGNNQVTGNTFYATDVVGSWHNPQCIEEIDGRVSFSNNRYVAHYCLQPFRKQHTDYSFTGWKSKTAQDANSTLDGSALKTGEKEQLFYNETKQSKTISFGNAVYRDLDGNEISGSIKLESFTSKILIKTTKVSNINQKPVIPGQSFNIQRNKEVNDFIGQVTANDPDIGQELQFAIIPESALFTIDPKSGEVFAKKKINITKDTTIVLSIVVTDNGTPPFSATANVTLNLVDLSSSLSEYLFEEASGAIVTDTKGSNNGAIVNNAKRVDGIIGKALEFNGSNYVNVGQAFGGNVSEEVSISAWIQPLATEGDFQCIIMHGGPNIDTYALYISPGSKSIGFKTTGTTSSWQSIANVEQLWDGNWHQITVTYNGRKKVIYMDGISISQLDASGKIESGAGFNLIFGAGRDDTPPSLLYKGRMDEVRVSNYALTAAEVRELYKLGVKATVYMTEEISICEGESYLNWEKAGKYERVLISVGGSDSIVTTNLRVNPIKYFTEEITIRAGESYQGWTNTGSFNRILTSSTGCDSIVTTNLNVLDNILTTENISICAGSSYQGWSKQGQYQRILPTASGADSIVVTNLRINPVKYSEEEVLIVNGESYNGWFETGEYQRTIPSVSGCDSIVTTLLQVVSTELTVEDIYICEGSSYQSWTKEGQYQRTLKTASGADSLVITNLWITPINYTTENITIKEGESYKEWTKPGVYENKLSSNSGCDSIVIINMTVLKSVRIAEEVTICEGSAYHNWSEPGQYQRTLKAASGADSIVTTILTVNPVVKTNEQISIIKGDSYMGWSVNGTYSRMLSSITGCDSIVVTDLKVTNHTSPNPDAAVITQSIDLRKGWNLVSTFLTPENPDMAEVQKDLVECNSLISVQDGMGRTFEEWGNQIGWVNTIGVMKETEGYKVQVRNNCVLEIPGQPVSLPLNITLKKGWNLISFPYTSNVNSMIALKQLIDADLLIKVQDEVGYALEYWGRSFGWMNRLGNFKPGKGYLVNVKKDAILTIKEAYEKSTEILADEMQISHFTLAYEGNGSSHMNINIKDINESGFRLGDEIAAFDNNICVGAIKLSESNFSNNVASISASACDSESLNGFTAGHSIELRLWNTNLGTETRITPEVIEGKMVYNMHSSVFISLEDQVATGINQYKKLEIEMFPNPTTEKVTIRFSQIPQERTQIFIFDLTGKQLIAREVQSTEEVLDVQSLTPGLYIVKTIVGNTAEIEKLMVQ